MDYRSCTIEAPSAEVALGRGAEELGLSPTALRVTPLGPALFRVETAADGGFRPGLLVRPGDALPASAATRVAESLGYLALRDDGSLAVRPLVTVQAEGKRAYVDLRDPSLSREEIETALQAAGVIHGVDLDPVWKLFEGHRGLPRPVAVAEWTPPTPGVPGEVEWHVEPRRAGERLPYRRRELFIPVQENDLLLSVSPGQAGRPGRRVDGVEVAPPVDPEAAGPEAGEGVRVIAEEDGHRRFVACRSGVLLVRGGLVSVIDLLEIAGDVDGTTGNIRSGGSVRIQGSVQEACEVHAGGDLWIGGSIEGGSVFCKGTLSVQGTIIGAAGSQVVARAGIELTRSQNARIHSDGDIHIADFDVGSHISCHGRIEVEEGHGALRGGDYAATRGIRAKELGSEMGVTTRVCAGARATLLSELARIERALSEADRARRKARRINTESRLGRSNSPVATATARRAVKGRRRSEGERATLRQRRRRLEALLAENVPATIRVAGQVHSGVRIRIEDAHEVIEESRVHVCFTYDPTTRSLNVEPLSP